MLVIQAHQIGVLGGGQSGDSHGGGACHHEGGVDLAVLQGVGAGAEVLVLGVDVILCQVIGGQDIQGVVVHAGARGADGDRLALQIRHGLDVRVTGDDLHLLHIQSSDSGEIRIGEPLKQPLAVIGVAHHVGLDEAQLGHVHLHLLDVVLGAVADHGRDLGSVAVGGDGLRQHAAEAVISTLVAAGAEFQLRAGAGDGRDVPVGLGSLLSAGVGGGIRLLRGGIAAAARQDRRQHQRGKKQG